MKKAAILLLGLSLSGCAVNTYTHPSPVYKYPTYYSPPVSYYYPPVYRRYHYRPYYRPYYYRYW